MLDEAVLERRLVVLESAVADIQHRLTDACPSSMWLKKVIGSVSDEHAFLDALEYGRAFRQAGLPPDESERDP